MIRHEYQTPNGPAYYWEPTPEEVRDAVASSLGHVAGGWDLKEQAGRGAQLERWYQLDGRDHPDHPLRGTFTGLAEIYGGPAPF